MLYNICITHRVSLRMLDRCLVSGNVWKLIGTKLKGDTLLNPHGIIFFSPEVHKWLFVGLYNVHDITQSKLTRAILPIQASQDEMATIQGQLIAHTHTADCTVSHYLLLFRIWLQNC